MSLRPGARLGPYQVIESLGAGGMGEVYKARDLRLDRTVALKILSPDIAGNPEFAMRFEREARIVSALNHPHICLLYDVGQQDGVDYLVLEYIEGETLATRLARGPLPLRQVLKYAIEIADALTAAHHLGIVHRDLKPGNIMLKPAGVKLVDFGLARPVGPSPLTTSLQTTHHIASTAAGTFVGTLQYMAPEQLQGREADARTDIFALGEIIHEMATGKRAFDAPTQASLIAKILETDPLPISTLAPLVPPALDHVVKVCLAKEPSDRWQTAHDVLMQLRWIQDQGSAADRPLAPRERRATRAWLVGGALAAAVAAAAIGWRLYSTRVDVNAPVTRFEITMPAQVSLPDFGWPTLSPDGRALVVPASSEGASQLYVRRLDELAFVALAGTDGARFPFWSPDSRSIAFFANGKLRRIDAAGGPATTLCDSPPGLRGTWNREGVILFSGPGGGLFRVADSGGTPVRVTSLDAGRRETGHRFPHFLPDGRSFLFTATGPEGGIYAGSLDSTPVTRVLQGDVGQSFYVQPGHILVVRQQTLVAIPFDVERRQASALAVPVARHVRGGLFSAAPNGNIAYRSGGDDTQLVWLARDGKRAGTVGSPGAYKQIVLSPSGSHVAIQQGGAGLSTQSDEDLWLLDLTTGVHSRLTNDPAFDGDPAWSPDERSLAFTSARTGRLAVFRKDLVTGAEERLTDSPDALVVDEWTPDGRFIVFRILGRAINLLPMTGTRTPQTLIDTPYDKDQSHVSPDGRWIAFNSDESGRWEVYVARFPDFSGKRQISKQGGMQPLWRRDSRELFYLSPEGTLMAVDIGAAAALQPGMPHALFPANLIPGPGIHQYAATANGQRFLIVERASKDDQSITFLLNWTPATTEK